MTDARPIHADPDAFERALLDVGLSRVDALDFIDASLDADRQREIDDVLARHTELARPLIAMRADRRRMAQTPAPASPRGLVAAAIAAEREADASRPRQHEPVLPIEPAGAPDFAAASADELAALRHELRPMTRPSGRRRLLGAGAVLASAAALALVAIVVLPNAGSTTPVAAPPAGPAMAQAPRATHPEVSAKSAPLDATLAAGDTLETDADDAFIDAESQSVSESLADASSVGRAAAEVVGPRVITDPDLAARLAADGRLALRLRTTRPDHTGLRLDRLAMRANRSWSVTPAASSRAAPGAETEAERLHATIETRLLAELGADLWTDPLADAGLLASANRDAPSREAGDAGARARRDQDSRGEAPAPLLGPTLYLLRGPAEAVAQARDALDAPRWAHVELIELPDAIEWPASPPRPEEALWWLAPPETWSRGATIPLIVQPER